MNAKNANLLISIPVKLATVDFTSNNFKQTRKIDLTMLAGAGGKQSYGVYFL